MAHVSPIRDPRAVRREGVVQLDATAMVPGEVLDAADRFVARLQLSTSPNRSVYFSPDELASEPVLFKWGLTEENLDLAEDPWPAGALSRRPREAGTGRWHRK